MAEKVETADLPPEVQAAMDAFAEAGATWAEIMVNDFERREPARHNQIRLHYGLGEVDLYALVSISAISDRIVCRVFTQAHDGTKKQNICAYAKANTKPN